ncbi:toll/interleukin-1 receptor domain-containing protein [Flavobacterium soyae]|uniref:toll/interleukin-1 receptor domain-containing protein n=1 Tax=Flavobacterium soyae TaxID=2903098 RepID=UPI001E63CDEF|nr:toll/interleukin-1 receptor domain-containing protein [Flavobacterium soyae]MCD9576333.1 toll/interleukin-1 receptor domain-containing protein [Flavobacterium soyae]
MFISHQQKDKDAAKKIADYLISAGIDVYFDDYDTDLKYNHQVNNAKAVTDSIRKGINNSSHMLVVVSPNTLYSTWVPFEIGYGYDKTALYALCLKGIPKGGLPEYVKTATIIRDIYDTNNLIENISGVKKEILFEVKMMSDYGDQKNPLSDVMDSLISESY